MIRRYGILLCQLCLVPVPVYGEMPPHTLLATDGNSYQVQTIPDGSAKSITVRQDQAERGIAWESVVRVGELPELSSTTVFVLRDASRWSLHAGETWQLDRISLTVQQGERRICSVPRELVRVIAMRTCVDPLARDQQFRMWHQATTQDRVWLSEADSFEGDLLLGSSAEITITRFGRQTRIPTQDVDAIHLRTIEGPSATIGPDATPDRERGRRALIGLNDGSTLWVQQMTMRGEHGELTMSDGQWTMQLDGSGGESARRVCLIQPQSTQIAYLSDLKPAGYRHIPYLGQPLPVQWNCNIRGDMLRLGNRRYALGVGMPSAARLALPIPAGFTHFAAEIGVDPAAGGLGSVVFRVLLMGAKGMWTEAFASPTLRGREEPVAIRVAVVDAQAIALVTDFSDRGDVLDLANWCDARFERETTSAPVR